MGIFDFDAFALNDIWKTIKKDPERLLIGAIDPLSTKMWNGITGKDYEPLIDQMGGPYGGHTISAFGNQDGGVYKRAEDAGIDTKNGGMVHDAAHVVSAFFGGQGLMGAGQGMFGSSGQNLGLFSNNGVSGMQGVGGGNAGLLAQQGGISGGAGVGIGNPMHGLLGGMPGIPGIPPQQQQEPPPQIPQQPPPWVNADAFARRKPRRVRRKTIWM